MNAPLQRQRPATEPRRRHFGLKATNIYHRTCIDTSNTSTYKSKPTKLFLFYSMLPECPLVADVNKAPEFFSKITNRHKK